MVHRQIFSLAENRSLQTGTWSDHALFAGTKVFKLEKKVTTQSYIGKKRTERNHGMIPLFSLSWIPFNSIPLQCYCKVLNSVCCTQRTISFYNSGCFSKSFNSSKGCLQLFIFKLYLVSHLHSQIQVSSKCPEHRGQPMSENSKPNAVFLMMVRN